MRILTSSSASSAHRAFELLFKLKRVRFIRFTTDELLDILKRLDRKSDDPD
jgi:hypothetical protein